ncbi:unnamed protein product [Bursaphelenchus okinawaensis]|uniref:Metalloendopeptidase n=1 Tax=Bursaphelenchus okinawaensis TaxID=465554 RepID=A0A811LKU4_9BILA|nr:unnamed protein product [Bursaphelenchus okinawaensis]CAG9123554.1 unnamed protein product [Bursaphelenchus okinawaensis]
MAAPPGIAPDPTLSNAAPPGQQPIDRGARTSDMGVSIPKPEVQTENPNAMLRSEPMRPDSADPAIPPSPRTFSDDSPPSIEFVSPASPAFGPGINTENQTPSPVQNLPSPVQNSPSPTQDQLSVHEPSPVQDQSPVQDIAVESASQSGPILPVRHPDAPPILPVRHPDAPPILPLNPSAVSIGSDDSAGPESAPVGPQSAPVGPDGRMEHVDHQDDQRSVFASDAASPSGVVEQPVGAPAAPVETSPDESLRLSNPVEAGISESSPMGMSGPETQPRDQAGRGDSQPTGPENQLQSQPAGPESNTPGPVQRGMQEPRGLGSGPGGWGIADAERAGLIQGKDLDNSKEGACSTCGPRNNFEEPVLQKAKEQGVTTPAPSGPEMPPRRSQWPNAEPCDEILDPHPLPSSPELILKPEGYLKPVPYKSLPQSPSKYFYRPNRKPKYGEITIAARDAIIETCRRIDCRTESVKAVEKYNEVHRTETDIQRIFNPFITPDQVHRRLAKIQKLKRSLLDAAGLGSEVEPHNDGTFQNDILLTESQTESMILRLRQQAERNRNKRSAIYVEQMPTNVWPQGEPIPVAFDGSLSENEKFEIQQALHAIETSTCIRFQPYPARPAGHHIYFVKVATPTFCGLSYIGKVSPANPIYLSFMCGDSVGVAIHEILHALGTNHEHLRFDRDRYLQMEWDNINPQLYDYFAVSDQTLYTTYGIPFDYSSIMLYGPFTGAVDRSRPSMKPINDDGRKIQMMGQRKSLSDRDVLLLNTMYCKSKDCIDQNVYCGLWALRKLCHDEPQSKWMQKHCRRSCGLC